jgi:hypothetical protein
MFVLVCTMVCATIIAKSIITYIYAFDASKHTEAELKKVYCASHTIHIKLKHTHAMRCSQDIQMTQ